MNYKKKYFKYKEKYLVLKAGAEHGNADENEYKDNALYDSNQFPDDDKNYIIQHPVYNIRFIYEHYSKYLSKDVEFIKKLINRKNYNHIPFRLYNDTIERFLSEELDDTNRLDNFDRFGKYGKKIVSDYDRGECKKYLDNLVKWLFDEIWKNFCIHGDLTQNNLIVDFNKQTVYIIDWENMLIFNLDQTNNIQKKCAFYLYILIDFYDVINSFSESFGITDYDGLKIMLEQIKNLESDIKERKIDFENYVNENKELLININNEIDDTFQISFFLLVQNILLDFYPLNFDF